MSRFADVPRAQLLRAAFAAGAVTDAVAVVPLTFPSATRLLWGFADLDGAMRFVMGYGASLMVGWTVLLVWAYRRPLERAFVAALTVLVIYGLIATEILAVVGGYMPWWRLAGTWILQTALLALFVGAYHHDWIARRLATTRA